MIISSILGNEMKETPFSHSYKQICTDKIIWIICLKLPDSLKENQWDFCLKWQFWKCQNWKR